MAIKLALDFTNIEQRNTEDYPLIPTKIFAPFSNLQSLFANSKINYN